MLKLVYNVFHRDETQSILLGVRNIRASIFAK